MEIDEWFLLLKKSLESLEQAKNASQDIAKWITENVTSRRALPSELRGALNNLDAALRQTQTYISDVDNEYLGTLYQFLWGKRLSREQFLLLSALRTLHYTNKTAGVSSLDDFDVFDLFYYEDDVRQGYIMPSLRPPDMEKIRAGLASEIVPERVLWDKLRPEQRSFFARHLPDVSRRFKR